MGHRFAELTFTLGAREAEFVVGRDGFYMASTGETGWPYVQHRGGPSGFVKVLGERTLGFADFRGNRQYVSVGNLAHDDRVALIFVDYPHRRRLKLLGRASVQPVDDALREILATPGYRAKIERAFLIRVEAFDWNCPQHITPRYTLAEVEAATAPLRARIAELEARLAADG